MLPVGLIEQVFPFAITPTRGASPFQTFGLAHMIRRALDKNAGQPRRAAVRCPCTQRPSITPLKLDDKYLKSLTPHNQLIIESYGRIWVIPSQTHPPLLAQRISVFMAELPFLHALVRVRPEEALAACLERQHSDEPENAGVASSFGMAYSQAKHVSAVQSATSSPIQLNLGAHK